MNCIQMYQSFTMETKPGGQNTDYSQTDI